MFLHLEDFVTVQDILTRLNYISYAQLQQAIDPKRSPEERKLADRNFTLSNEISKFLSVLIDYYLLVQILVDAVETMEHRENN